MRLQYQHIRPFKISLNCGYSEFCEWRVKSVWWACVCVWAKKDVVRLFFLRCSVVSFVLTKRMLFHLSKNPLKLINIPK